MPLVLGAIVPHAPLLLPELESDEVAEAAKRIREALGLLDISAADVVVLLSPHAWATGIYESTAGSLEGFGIPGGEVADVVDKEASKHLADFASLSLLGRQVDHGVVVPLRLRGWKGPIVAVGFKDEASLEATRAAARPIAAGIASVAETRRVAVVASVNGSAGLSARAPLTELPGAAEIEDQWCRAVTGDWAALGSVAHNLRMSGGSCAQGPLEVLATLFGGRKGRVLAHEAPVGVGYMVAVTDV